MFDTDSNYCSEDEDNGWGYEHEDDKELVQPPLSSSSSPSSSSSSWGPPKQLGRRGVNIFFCWSSGDKFNESPYVNKDSTPFFMFMLFFTGTIHLLVEETNRY
jgi:hypothetical protein